MATADEDPARGSVGVGRVSGSVMKAATVLREAWAGNEAARREE